jgi:hypothetical protein
MMQNYHVWFFERTWRHASLKLFNPLHLFTKHFCAQNLEKLSYAHKFCTPFNSHD